MIIEIKVQTEDQQLWDSVVLTREMLNELIDNNPEKLKEIIQKLEDNIPRNPYGTGGSPEDKKGMSYLLSAAASMAGVR